MAEHYQRPGWFTTQVFNRVVAGLTLFDDDVVDGVVEGTALGVGGAGSVIRLAQTGFVRSYALSVLGGGLLVVLALLAVNLA